MTNACQIRKFRPEHPKAGKEGKKKGKACTFRQNIRRGGGIPENAEISRKGVGDQLVLQCGGGGGDELVVAALFFIVLVLPCYTSFPYLC
jgi:hypothetical protein